MKLPIPTRPLLTLVSVIPVQLQGYMLISRRIRIFRPRKQRSFDGAPEPISPDDQVYFSSIDITNERDHIPSIWVRNHPLNTPADNIAVWNAGAQTPPERVTTAAKEMRGLIDR